VQRPAAQARGQVFVAEGILETMAARKASVETPSAASASSTRHASWLNQVEIWFSILARRASFPSVDDLRQRLLAFIEYFHAVLATPFR
jgi:hypothetical protein